MAGLQTIGVELLSSGYDRGHLKTSVTIVYQTRNLSEC